MQTLRTGAFLAIYKYTGGKPMRRTVAILAALLLLAALAACGQGGDEAGTTATTAAMVEASTAYEVPEPLGEGSKSFRVYVLPMHGDAKVYTVHSDHIYLGDALLELGLIEGEESSMGLMVSVVDGIRADYELDGAWWRFAVNWEDALIGVSQVTIEEGATYIFEYTPA